MSLQDKLRRLWRLAVATHPRTQQIEYELQVPQSGTYIMKPTASCEAAQLWVYMIPQKRVPQRGTDTAWYIVTYYTVLTDNLLWVAAGLHLLWEAAGLRRDAVAS